MKTVLKKTVVCGVALAALIGGPAGGLANAATPASHQAHSSQQTLSGLAQRVNAAKASVSVGANRLVDTINGYDIYVAHNTTGFYLQATTAGSSAPAVSNATHGTNGTVKLQSACSVAVASAVYALGAAALAAAAASGGLEVAGVFLAPEILSQLSAAASSFSAVEAIIAQYVC